MSCIDRRPLCGAASGDIIPEPIKEIGSVIGTIGGIAGALGGILKAAKVIGTLGAGSAGAISGSIAAIGVIIIVGCYAYDRCKSQDGLAECLAGVVQKIVQDFSSTIEEIFPFTAMHDRVDVVVKSKYWEVVESNQSKVFCTDEEPPRRSEIIRCYYFTSRVCNAARGAVLGAGIGGVVGIIAAAAVAAAIGCATIILCLFALLVAVLIAAGLALAGALAGGQIGKAVSDNTTPETGTGSEIKVGDLITLHGNMLRRDYDEGANVFWWVKTSSLSGSMTENTPNNPYSYCEIDDIFSTDECPIIIY
jgi:hypothetical protein